MSLLCFGALSAQHLEEAVSALNKNHHLSGFVFHLQDFIPVPSCSHSDAQCMLWALLSQCAAPTASLGSLSKPPPSLLCVLHVPGKNKTTKTTQKGTKDRISVPLLFVKVCFCERSQISLSCQAFFLEEGRTLIQREKAQTYSSTAVSKLSRPAK